MQLSGTNYSDVRLESDGQGGVLETWTEYSEDTMIYAQRLSENGAELWGAGGLLLCSAGGYRYHRALLADGTGGGFFTWLDNRAGSYYHAYGQHVAADGSVTWESDGVCLHYSDSHDGNPSIVSDLSGGAIFLFPEWSTGTMYATHLNSEGQAAWPFAMAVTDAGVVDQVSNNQPYAVSDGVGGCIFTFSQPVDEPVKSGQVIAAQRVTAAGVRAWGNSGIAVTDESFPVWRGCARLVPCAQADQGGAVIVWRDYRNGSTTEVYAMGIDATGQLGSPCSGYSTAWSTDPETNLAVAPGNNDQYSHRLIRSEDGGYLLVWQQEPPAKQSPDVYIQKFDASGDRLWGETGILVCTNDSGQYEPKLCTDGAGGAIVAWMDQRDEIQNIYAQWVDASGVARWDDEGVQVSHGAGSAECPFCAADDQGGAFVVFQSSGSYCQRILASGEVAWPSPVHLGGNSYENTMVDRDGSGGAVICWLQMGVIGTDVYAQRLNAAGVKQWGSNGVAVCDAADDQQCSRIMGDGAGGCLVLWNDYRDGESFNLYIQKVSAAGVPLWTDDGIPLSAESYYLQGHGLADDGAGGAIVTWHSAGDQVVYARRIDATGTDVWGECLPLTGSQWEDIDLVDSPSSTVEDGIGGAMVVYTAWWSVKAPPYVMAQRVSAAGTLPWGIDGLVLCNNPSNERYCARAACCGDGSGGVLACWRDLRVYPGNLCVMGANLRGELGAPCSSTASTQWSTDTDTNLKVTDSWDYQYTQRAVADDDGSFYIAWTRYVPDDGGTREETTDIYVQKFDHTGNRMWAWDGVPVCTDERYQCCARITPDGTGGVLLFWMDERDEESHIYGQRITSAGIPAWTTDGIRVSGLTAPGECPFTAPDGQGGSYVIWRNEHLYCQRVGGDGSLQWPGELVLDDGIAQSGKIMPDGYGNAIVCWAHYDETTSDDVHAQKVTPAGTLPWGTSSLVVCDHPSSQGCARLAADDAGGAFILWQDGRTNPSQSAFLQHISSSGNLLWSTDGVQVSDGIGPVQAPDVVGDGQGGVIATWVNDGTDDLNARRFTAAGVDLWGGILEMTDDGEVYYYSDTPHQAVADGQGGAIAVYVASGETRNGSRIEIQRIAYDGTLPWGSGGIALCTTETGDRQCPRVVECRQDFGGALAYWTDTRNDYSDLYLMGINPDGVIGDPCAPLGSPTPAPSPTQTAAPSETPEPSPTMSPTRTPTPSSTPTRTPTPLGTSTPTPTPTNSPTPAADLVARSQDISFDPSYPATGQNTLITAIIRNDGGAAAGYFTVRFFGDYGAGPVQIGSDQGLAGLAAGTQQPVSLFWTATCNSTIYVTADADNVIPEPSEGNNTGIRTEPIVYCPNRVILAVTPETRSVPIGAESSFTITVTNNNLGPETVDLAVGGDLPPAWYSLLPDQLVLAAGQTGGAELAVTVPDECGGVGMYGFQVTGTAAQTGDTPADTGTLTVTAEVALSQRNPADNATTGSRDVTFSWQTSATADCTLYYRPAGDAWSSAAAGNGQSHQVDLLGLERNQEYEWYIDYTSLCGAGASATWSFTVGNGVVFLQDSYSFTVARDYDQHAWVAVQNQDVVGHTVALHIDNPNEELIVNFVGPGSDDETIELGGGQTADVELVIHAQDVGGQESSKGRAELCFENLVLSLTADEAGDPITDSAPTTICVTWPNIDFALMEEGETPVTEVKSCRVSNAGDALTDLAVSAAGGLVGRVLFIPRIEHYRLDESAVIDFEVEPLFQAGQPQLSGDIVASAAGEQEVLSLSFDCASPRQLWEVVVAGAELCYPMANWFCTNRPSISMPFEISVNMEEIDTAVVYTSFAPHSDVRPHYIDLFINGNLIGELNDIIPSGTYGFAFDPGYLNVAPGGTAANIFSIVTQHFNGGHYVVSTNSLVVLALADSTMYVCAETQQQADELAPDLPHVCEGYTFDLDPRVQTVEILDAADVPCAVFYPGETARIRVRGENPHPFYTMSVTYTLKIDTDGDTGTAEYDSHTAGTDWVVDMPHNADEYHNWNWQVPAGTPHINVTVEAHDTAYYGTCYDCPGWSWSFDVGGGITGYVRDAGSWAPLSGATVNASGHGDTTGGDGYYDLARLPNGTYDVTAGATGYVPQTLTGLVVNGAILVNQDFALVTPTITPTPTITMTPTLSPTPSMTLTPTATLEPPPIPALGSAGVLALVLLFGLTLRGFKRRGRL
ncbi:carboxypeptidase regulatory-like domain-containing protein [bacterium]|nr:carboxypeptidase regulatory-like domain-containing protein [candidate division CSSED10-310 bacterium]